jgi:hypothetical protein
LFHDEVVQMTSKKQGTSAPALAEGNRGHFSATSSAKPIT